MQNLRVDSERYILQFMKENREFALTISKSNTKISLKTTKTLTRPKIFYLGVSSDDVSSLMGYWALRIGKAI